MAQQQHISALEASNSLGVSLDFLYQLLWNKRIEAHKEGRTWKVSVASVEEYRKGRNYRKRLRNDHKNSD